MRPLLLAALALAIPATAALADDQAECRAGIQMIKAEIAKAPAAATLTKLQRALRAAERELGENEIDECLEAIDEARAALRR